MLITVAIVSVLLNVLLVVLGEYRTERHLKILRDHHVATFREREQTEAKYMELIRDLSTMIKADKPIDAVNAKHIEQVNKLEREVLEFWKAKNTTEVDVQSSSIPQELVTKDGRVLELLTDI